MDVWPGHWNGHFQYGFPVRGELFRLDGSCDSTMTSQATLIALALSALLDESTPPAGI